tara:strand:- start:8902 stop:9009 length:108 start_codon:yes stop_codon:yes gene_type:complete
MIFEYVFTTLTVSLITCIAASIAIDGGDILNPKRD